MKLRLDRADRVRFVILLFALTLVTGLSNGGYIWLRSRAERGRR